MKVTPVSGVEQVAWGAVSIMRRLNAGVFICTCNVQSVEYKCLTKHSFVYDRNFRPLHKTKCCEVIIDNRSDAPIFVLEDKDRESNKKFDHALKEFFGGLCHVENVYRITPC